MSVVHLGGVKTKIATSSDRGVWLDLAMHAAGLKRSETLLMLDTEDAAARILKGLPRREADRGGK